MPALANASTGIAPWPVHGSRPAGAWRAKPGSSMQKAQNQVEQQEHSPLSHTHTGLFPPSDTLPYQRAAAAMGHRKKNSSPFSDWLQTNYSTGKAQHRQVLRIHSPSLSPRGDAPGDPHQGLRQAGTEGGAPRLAPHRCRFRLCAHTACNAQGPGAGQGSTGRIPKAPILAWPNHGLQGTQWKSGTRKGVA